MGVNLMKKLNILILLSAFLCLSGFLAHAQVITDGSVNVLQTESDLIRHRAERCFAKMTKGFAGIDTDCDVLEVTADENLNDVTCYTQTEWHQNKNGYTVMQGDFFFGDGVSQFMLATTTHAPVSQKLVAGNHFELNQWCRLTFIYDGTDNTVDTYCNEELVDVSYPTVVGTDPYYMLLRMVYYCDASSKVYLANWRMYETTFEPVVDNELYIENFSNSNVVTVEPGALFSASITLSDPDARVTVYTDNTYSNIKDASKPLESGNIIAMKNDCRIRTYKVAVDDGAVTESEMTDGKMTFYKASTVAVGGLFGKSADDDAVKVTASGSVPCFSSFTWLDDEFDGYVRADVNIEPGNMDKIYIGTNVHLPVSDALKLNSGRWNRVSVVYDTASYDETEGCGKADTYVNGVKVCTVKTEFTNLWQLRIIMNGQSGSYAYVDDFKFVTYRYNAPAVPHGAHLTGNVNIVNDTLRIDGDVKVSSLTADQNAVIRVYGDSSFSCELSADETLQTGNTIVLCTADSVYTYYTAASGSEKILREINDNSTPLRIIRGYTESASGLGGKASGDESVGIVVDNADSKSNNAYEEYKWIHDGYKGFLVTELNVLTAGAAPALATNGHRVFAPTIGGLVPERWNKIVAVYDAASYDGAVGKTYLYVNGKYSGTADTDFTSGSVVRLIAYAEEKGGLLYIDDYKIYETDSLPVITVPDIGSNYYVSDGKVNIDADTTPSSLKSGALTLRVYSDGTFSHLIGDDEVIADGNVIVAEDVNKTLTYYEAVCHTSKRILATANDASLGAGLSVIDAEVGAVSGFGGRENGDESIMLTVTGAKDGYIGYIDNGYSGKNYIAYEVSVYPENDGKIYFATNGHAALSGYAVVGRDCTPNQWNRFVLIVNRERDTAAFYVNGNFISEKSTVNFPTDSRKDLRFIYQASGGARIVADDAVVYESDLRPTVAKAAVVPQSVEYILFNRDLYLPSDVRYAQLRSVLGVGGAVQIEFVKDGVQVQPINGIVPDGTIMALKNAGALTSYDIHVTHAGSPFAYGEAATDGRLSDGVLTAAVLSDGGAEITVAAYKDGKLVSLSKPTLQTSGRYSLCNIEADTELYDCIKLFSWRDVSLLPLGKNAMLSR